MACPTCDHTMQSLNGGPNSWFWCPRCGTIKQRNGLDTPPKLVKRVAEFVGTLSDEDQEIIDAFESIGLRESRNIERQVSDG